MLKIKNKKYLIGIAFFVMMVSIFLTPFASVRADGTWSDEKDDLKCFTKAQLEAFGIILEDEDPSDANELIQAIENYWDVGTWSATPDCIDMLKIEVTELGDMATLTITVEGNVKDCSQVAFLIFGNCSGNPWGMYIYYNSGGTGGGETEMFHYTDEEGNSVSGTPDISGSEVEVSYPQVENCQLNILALTYNKYSELVCADMFPDESSFSSDPDDPATGGPGDSTYTGIDPITMFFDWLAGVIFGVMCGRLDYLMLMSIFIVLCKVLIDRKNRAALIIGIIFSIIVFWSLIWYSLYINFLSTDPLLTFSVMSILDFITCIFFMAFLLFTYANRFNVLNDNEWSFFFGYALMFIESILFMTPNYFYYCSGQPTLSLIIEILLLLPFIGALYLTEKLSKGRLK